MTFSPAQPPPPPASPVTVGQALASAPARGAWRDRLPTGRRLWWTLAIGVIVLAVGFCLWIARDLWRRPDALPPGAGFTDRLGVTYTVVAVEKVDEVPDGLQIHTAPEGAVLLRYIVAVDNYVWIENDPYSTVCSFELVRDDGQRWDHITPFDEHRTKICLTDEEEITASQQVYPVFEVPENQVDRIIGLVGDTVPEGDFPIISPP